MHERLKIYLQTTFHLPDQNPCPLIFLIQGPNGVGKTTFITQLFHSAPFKESWGFLMQEQPPPLAFSLILWHDLVSRSFLNFSEKQLYYQYLHNLELDQILPHTDLRELSPGQWQKLRLATHLAQHKSIWILDEPDQNLDSESTKWLFNQLDEKLREKQIILLISHHIQWQEKWKLVQIERPQIHPRIKLWISEN